MNENQREGRYCPECGMSATDRQHFCRQCGFEFPPEDVAEERQLRAAIQGEGGPSCLGGCFKVVGFFIFLGILGAVLANMQHMRRYKERAPIVREKACYANMRVLLGAVEMYNMDNNVLLKRFDDDAMNTLVRQNYLKGGIHRPEPGCGYTSTGDLTVSGKITCDVHGTVD